MRVSGGTFCLALILSAGAFAPAYAWEPQPGTGSYTAGAVSGGYALQPAYAPSPRPNYGGGLVEALIGPDRTQSPASPLPEPQAYTASAQPFYGYADPRQMPAPGAYAVQPGKLLDPMYQRQEVAFEGREAPGTILVDTQRKFLYLVEDGGQAMRYGIGVGRPGFLWHGTKVITRKAEWPDWTPPSEMLLRRPDLPTHMDGGMANPLGARAMYLGSSLYRIHGTNEPETIGTNVSSGCIRLTNEDVSDLYSRVRVGTRVVVM